MLFKFSRGEAQIDYINILKQNTVKCIKITKIPTDENLTES